ncbi:hypothetical protein HYT24_03315 [Candidatus Pacearchaeota archaeon]|nr:hypothetical protein [Candidatus Pacearchaeota archaeon]
MLDYIEFSYEIAGVLGIVDNRDYEIEIIQRFVRDYQQRKNIVPRPGVKVELPCFAVGEDINLLYTQLVTTPEGTGSWGELQHKEVRKSILARILRDVEWELKHPTKH